MDEDLDSLLARQKKEQKALVSQITSLKKTVTKGEKSKRKEVLAEVQRLEDELKERHQRELKDLQSSTDTVVDGEKEDISNGDGEVVVESVPVQGIQELSLDDPPATGKKGKPKVNRQKARMVRSYG
jgi:OTU domain-containing protein 6